MKFQSNKCLAIHLPDLDKAEHFYSDALGLKLVSKTKKYLEYDTGAFLLYVNKGPKKMPPIPSFSVASARQARKLLQESGCKIIDDRKGSFYFKDPFGIVYDVIEE